MKKPPLQNIEIVVIGTSAGGVTALRAIFSRLRHGFPFPIAVVQHLPSNSRIDVSLVYGSNGHKVIESEDKMQLQPNTIYMASPSYHLLLERDMTLALTQDEPVHYSRPSIDVFFESVSRVSGKRVIAILMTGANADGAQGMRAIQDRGGITLVQKPEEAEADAMPRAALELIEPTHIFSVAEIAEYLNQFVSMNGEVTA